jgi:hypothetical protein
MFDRTVALVSAVTVLLSTGYIYYSAWHLDAVWPPFLLASLAILMAARQPGSLGLGAIAGACAAAAFVIKEAAIFFVAVPALWYLVDRRHIALRTVVAFYLLVGAVVCLWLVEVFLPATQARAGYETATSALSPSLLSAWRQHGVWGLIQIGMLGLWGYFLDFSRWAIPESFPILPALGVAGILTLARGLTLGGPFRLAALCLLAYLPLVAFVGYWAMRPSQLLFVNVLLVICFFALVGDIAAWLAHKWQTPVSSLRGTALALTGAALTLIQAFAGYPDVPTALRQSLLVGLTSGKYQQVYLPGQEVANYLVQHVKPEEGIACVEAITCNALKWYAPQLKLVTIPQHYIANELGWRGFLRAPTDGKSNPLSISSNWRASFAESNRWQLRGAMLFLYEQPLQQRLSRTDLRYLVVESNSQFPNLIPRLDQAIGLQRVLTVDDTRAYHYAVYRRTAEAFKLPATPMPVLTTAAQDFAIWLIAKKNDQYDFYNRSLPGATMNRSLEELLAEHKELAASRSVSR